MAKKTEFSISLKLLADKFNKNLNSIQNRLKTFKGAVAGMLAGISVGNIFSSITKSGGEFENQMARVKAVSKATTEEFKMMKDEAERLGATTRFSASQAAEALENLTRNGFSATKATKALSGVMSLAGSQAISLAEAADLMTAALNGFQMSVEETTRVNDVLASAAANSATNAFEMGEALKYVAPLAGTLRMSIEDVSAAIGQMANNGVKGSQAGTSLKAMIAKLTDQTKEGADVLKKYNLNINETTIRNEGLAKTIEKLSKANMSTADMSKLFGREAIAGIASVLSNADKYAELLGKLQNSAGEADRMFKEGIGRYENAKAEFASAAEGAAIKAFDKIKPILVSIINTATSFIGSLQNIPMVIATSIGAAMVLINKFLFTTRQQIKAIEAEQYASQLATAKAQYAKVAMAHKVVQAAQKSGFNAAQGGTYAGFIKELERIQKEAIEAGQDVTQLNILLKKTQTAQASYAVNNRSTRGFGQSGAALAGFNTVATNNSLKGVQQQLDNVQKKGVSAGTTLKGAFLKIGTGIKAIGSSIYSFMGGWVGILLTVVSIVGVKLVGAFQEANRKANLLTNALKENAEMTESLKAKQERLINIMRTSEKGSRAWLSAYKELQSQYPELFEYLDMEKIHINTLASDYENLKNKINEATDARLAQENRKFVDDTIKTESETDTVKTTYDKLGKTLKDYITDFSDRNNLKVNEATIDIAISKAMARILERVKGGEELTKNLVKETLQGQIQEFIPEFSAHYFERRNSGDIKSFINSQKYFTDAINTLYSKLVYPNQKQGDRLATGNTTNERIDEEEDDYTPITTTSEVTDAIEAAEKAYQRTLNNNNKLLELELITEKDFNKRMLSALETLIKAYLDYPDSTNFNADIIRGYINLANIFKEDESAAKLDEISNQLKDRAKENTKEFIAKREKITTDAQSRNSLRDKLYRTEETKELDAIKERRTKNQDRVAELENEIEYFKKVKDLLKDIHNLEGLTKKDKASLFKILSPDMFNLSDIKNAEDLIQKKQEEIETIDNLDKLDAKYQQLAETELELKRANDDMVHNFYVIGKSGASAIDGIYRSYLNLNRLNDENISGFEKFMTVLQTITGQFENMVDLYREIRNNIKLLKNINEVKKDITEKRNEISSIENLNQLPVMLDERAEKPIDVQQFNLPDTQQEKVQTSDVTQALANNAMVLASNEAVAQSEEAKGIASASATGQIIANDTAQAASKTALSATEMATDAATTATNVASNTTKVAGNTAAAGSAAAASAAGLPFPANLIAVAGAVSSVLGILASLPKFADGGIIAGNSYYGDKQLVRANAGEMILTQRQQSNLFNMIGNSGKSAGNHTVTFKVKGKDLQATLQNYQSAKNKVK